MPKKGVVTASSLCHRPPSAGRRRWTSFDVRLVFQLQKLVHKPEIYRGCQTNPVVTEQNLPPVLLELLLASTLMTAEDLPIQVENCPKYPSPFFFLYPVF